MKKPQGSYYPELQHLQKVFASALSAYQAGQLDRAATLCREVLAKDKRQPAPLQILGIVEAQRGNLKEGIRCVEKAIKLDPSSPEAWLNLGLMLGESNDLIDAERSLKRSLCLNSKNALAFSNLGIVYKKLERYDEALKNFEHALALEPQNQLALLNYGNVLFVLKRFGESEVAYKSLLKIDPNIMEAWLGLGRIGLDNDREEEAGFAFDRAYQLSPSSIDAMLGRAQVLLHFKKYLEAIPVLQRIIDINPKKKHVKQRLFFAKMIVCAWDNYEQDIAECVRSIDEYGAPALPYDSVIVTQDPARQLACAEALMDSSERKVTVIKRNRSYNHDKIRIGYVSPDFRDHAVGRVVTGLFEHHNRACFELYGFSTSYDHSRLRTRISSAFDFFSEIDSEKASECAECFRDHEIDILIDLAGHTTRSGLFTMTTRPAPVQATWLGFPGSTGAPFMDYIIADRTVIPEGHDQFYSEKVVRLPDTYQPNDDALVVSAPPTREAAGLPAAGLVFCCFNNTFKITPEVFDIWMRLLSQVESSVLWLFESNATAKANLKKEAAARGVSPERLIFAPLADYPTYLARTQLADMFLDNNYWNGHSTASDALRCGVPVITCQGSSFASRVASSLLKAIGLPELVTHSLEEYEALALKLARDPALLASIKVKLAANRLTTPLFDTARFTRHLEAAYIKMYERSQQGLPPESFSVDPLP